MHPSRRAKYSMHSIRALKELRDELTDLITEMEKLPKRSIDIGHEFCGDATLIHTILEKEGDEAGGKWNQLMKINCSSKKCDKCPHGPYWYSVRRNKKGQVRFKFTGELFFDYETLKNIQLRAQKMTPIFQGSMAEFRNRKDL